MDLYRVLEHVDIRKCRSVGREPAVRFYCIQRGGAWNLQVRAPITLDNGREGKDFIIATASIYREDLLALRDAIDNELKTEQGDG
jgi:hypothetical protein